jgi:hypothetical protein
MPTARPLQSREEVRAHGTSGTQIRIGRKPRRRRRSTCRTPPPRRDDLRVLTRIPVSARGFWRAWPHMRAADFAAFLRLAREGTPP